MHLVMADQGGNSVLRDYRKGNWTVPETMVLIEAKKMDDERRMKRSGDSEGRSKPAELRWKWVEDYCWRKGCLRSQNQCNDKWDNLMRDYKKVRDYERRLAEKGDGNEGSYWKIEKNERKEKNLPSNMLPQIYDALVEVVERKGAQRIGDTGGSVSNPSTGGYVVERPINVVQPPIMPSPLLQHHISAPISALPLPPPPAAAAAQPHPLPYSHQPLPTTVGWPVGVGSLFSVRIDWFVPYVYVFEMCDSSDSDTSEYSDSPAKRRRRGEGTSGTASGSTSHEVGSAISKSASIIAEAIQACEEREEGRHRDLLNLHERRLQIEESKTEINRKGMNGLVDAINNLANSILALAAHKNQSTPK